MEGVGCCSLVILLILDIDHDLNPTLTSSYSLQVFPRWKEPFESRTMKDDIVFCFMVWFGCCFFFLIKCWGKSIFFDLPFSKYPNPYQHLYTHEILDFTNTLLISSDPLFRKISLDLCHDRCWLHISSWVFPSSHTFSTSTVQCL